jgi:anti-sigma factor RsiW
MQHLDEGMIHAWLDGQLPRDEAQAVEAHVAECRQCADAVAEARGLIAASSRILMALDGVPREVVPIPATRRVDAGAVAGAPSSLEAAPAPLRAERRAQRRWFSGPSLAAAAAVVVAVGTFALMRVGNRPPADSLDAPAARLASGPFADSTSPTVATAASPAPPAPAPVALGGSRTAPSPAKDAPVTAEARTLRDAGGGQAAQNAAGVRVDATKEQLQRQVAQAPTSQGFTQKSSAVAAANEATADRLERSRQLATPPQAAAADERKKAVREEIPAAKSSGDSSGRIGIRGTNSLVGRVDSGVARADAAAGLQTVATGAVRGRVTDGNNTGLAGAMVNIVGSTSGVAANSAGEFTIAGLSAGVHRLAVRRLGYAPVNREVAIVVGDTVAADVVLSPTAVAFENVVTTGSASASRSPAAPSPARATTPSERARRAEPNLETPSGAPLTATQSNAVGCYEVGITPLAAQARTGFRQVPRRIALDAEIAPTNAEGVWYRARDLARVGAVTNGLWRPAGPEAIELEWSFGTRTDRVRLAGSAGSMMRGTIEEIDRANATGEAGTVVAVRRACEGQ